MKAVELIEKKITTVTKQYLSCHNCNHNYDVTNKTPKELKDEGWVQFRGVLICPSCYFYYKRNS